MPYRYSKAVELEEQLRIVGNDLKSLEANESQVCVDRDRAGAYRSPWLSGKSTEPCYARCLLYFEASVCGPS